jgi:hypothetical protein
MTRTSEDDSAWVAIAAAVRPSSLLTDQEKKQLTVVGEEKKKTPHKTCPNPMVARHTNAGSVSYLAVTLSLPEANF